MMNEKPRINNNGWASLDPVDSGLFEGLSKKDSREREERLMQAVLENAIEYFQKYVLAKDERGKKLFQEAEEWILDKDSDWFFSFENICEGLGLHPDYIRQGLKCWKGATRKRPPSHARHGGCAKCVRTRVVHTSI